MKKYGISLMLLSMIIFIAACGSDDMSADDDHFDDESGEKENVDVSEEDTKTEDQTDNEESDENDYYFEDNKLENEDVEIEITDYKVKDADEVDDSDKVVVFYYDATLKEDAETDDMGDSGDLWMDNIGAEQDNTDDYVNNLEVGTILDEDHSEEQFKAVKPGGTVSGNFVYELDDEETPVTLIGYSEAAEDNIGTSEFNID